MTPDGSAPDEDTLARIRSLAVPPARGEVWIRPDERGHLQAVGTDAAGRRQYQYHDPRVLEQHARGAALPPEVARRSERRSEPFVREMLS